jgi:hypothetical protein
MNIASILGLGVSLSQEIEGQQHITAYVSGSYLKPGRNLLW